MQVLSLTGLQCRIDQESWGIYSIKYIKKQEFQFSLTIRWDTWKRQEEERFFQIIFEENSHVLFRYICGQLNNDRETAKDVLNDVWEVLVVKFETVADLEGEEMTKWLFCVAKNKIKNQRRKHYYQNEVSYTQYQKENRNEGEAAATAEIEERMVMQNCIQNLNPMDQRIFWGRAYGFSYKELSGFCKKSEQALQCQYSRAIKKLQGMMSQEISLSSL